ncbi:type II toxin-antitoxin system VapC family toxin [Mesorhizobium retamae]|uniref:Type II toxin-antitoxin system VapC family toxin n=1 Tax=Mesorhizobium retamae TaxID=2912854 RepID=A0ABS9QNZ7_9HYPH|nr:type II toxin-antitoxin system VapC family toxin [Mesorhizobium sp. IRAMC:0171]MCG7508431.1 type II toxin-antitoxin system VapC family toxin [Mesorhizobium sp. IRAMC:0171]
MLFIDASVIVAIIGLEDDADDLMDRLTLYGGPFYVSAVTRMEAVLAVTRQFAEAEGPNKTATPVMLAKARQLVDQFIADMAAKETMISGDVGSKALDAAQRYGKIVNHPAKLNMGDCFTYACAQAYRLRIAYKGGDFTETDLAW